MSRAAPLVRLQHCCCCRIAAERRRRRAERRRVNFVEGKSVFSSCSFCWSQGKIENRPRCLNSVALRSPRDGWWIFRSGGTPNRPTQRSSPPLPREKKLRGQKKRLLDSTARETGRTRERNLEKETERRRRNRRREKRAGGEKLPHSHTFD